MQADVQQPLEVFPHSPLEILLPPEPILGVSIVGSKGSYTQILCNQSSKSISSLISDGEFRMFNIRSSKNKSFKPIFYDILMHFIRTK